MLAYHLVIFDRHGRESSRIEYLSCDDETARRHVPQPAPYGGELRRGDLVVARYGATALPADRPERGSIYNLERIFRPSAGHGASGLSAAVRP